MGMVDVVVPALGESIKEATIAAWHKKPGDAVKRDEAIVDLDTDKVSVSVPSPADGVLKEQRFAPGATVKVGQAIAAIEAGAVAAAPVAAPRPMTTRIQKPAPAPAPPPVAAPAPVATPAPVAAASGHDGGAPALSPSVRRSLREHGLDAAAVKPAMPGGRLTPADVAAAAQRPAPAPIAVAGSADGEEVVPMTPLRRRIAERLVHAQHSAAILTTFNEVDMANVMALRARHGEAFKAKHGVKLGFMSFFVRAVVDGLREQKGLNAEIRGDAIVYKKHYDLGVAVGGGAGLVVPVIRGADQLSFAALEQTIAALAEKAKDRKLTLAELTGGTFSITNGGVYGSLLSTPLLNPPQTGILGMHNIVKRPIAVDDKVEIRPMMYIALSYDHRVVDGREAVSFLVGVKRRIEEPERLMLDV